MMVKLTIVGRVSDGLPLAQGPRYINEEENENLFSSYQEQGEFILKEISRGALPPSKMVIHVDHHYSFNYMVENGFCFITLCDSSLPRKLVFHYLQDLNNEFEKFNLSLLEKITKPYSFVKFDGIIGITRRQYIDTRTQANLSKLNANCQDNPDFITAHMSEITERRQVSAMLEKMMEGPQNVSPLWCSKSLEVMALKWIPITTVLIVSGILLWTSLILKI